MKTAWAAGALFLISALSGAAAASEGSGMEISSAAKTKQTHPQKPRLKPMPRPHSAVRAPQSAPFGWRPADPSFDQQGRRYQPPPGLNCPVDLGYGRWASCNDEI